MSKQSPVLRNSTALELLKDTKDNSVDLIVVDPPYFQIVKNEWDNQWKDETEYLQWCAAWTKEAERVLKPGGCFLVWGTTKTDTFLRYKLDVLNATSMIYQNWIIWHYDWGGRTKKTFPRKHEDLLMYSKGKSFLFNADDVRVPYAMKKNIRKGVKNNQLGKVPTDVWQKNNHTMSKEYAGWHPTQKPLMIMERIIKAYSNEGDVVMDFFSGSGSTMIACERLGRRFIGCDVNKEYCEKSLERKAQDDVCAGAGDALLFSPP